MIVIDDGCFLHSLYFHNEGCTKQNNFTFIISVLEESNFSN